MHRSRSLVLVVCGALACASGAGVAAVAAAQPAQPAAAVASSRTAAPATAQPDLPRSAREMKTRLAALNLVAERVFVESTTDTDNDGRKDRIAIDITRDSSSGRQDAILQLSPYVEGLNSAQDHNVDVDRLPQENLGLAGVDRLNAKATSRPRPASLLDTMQNQLLVTGYATIKGHSVGTGASEGCPTTGDAAEVAGGVAIIDWLNGRTKGYNSSGQEVRADWATGRVGMTGVSYDGSLPNMVAASGVDGLKAIIPVAAIANWSDYYRSNGLVVAPGGYQGEDADVLAKAVVKDANKCSSQIASLTRNQGREHGDFTAFWDARNYLDDASKVKAGVFVVHGHSDWNVKGQNYARWWDALEKANVPRKIWVHNGGHANPSRSTYSTTVQRFFDYWVKGQDNGIMREPMADIQMGDGSWRTAANWPDPAALPVTFTFGTTSSTAPGTLNPMTPSGGPAQTFTDNGKVDKAATLAASPDSASSKRLVFLTPALTAAATLSGPPTVTLNASVDNRKDANLTALLVSYNGSTPTIVTRGWVDPQNRNSDRTSEPLTMGQKYRITFPMQPKEYTFTAGSRIGVVVISTDYDYTLRPSVGTVLGLDPTGSSITMRLKGYAGPTPTPTPTPTVTATPTATPTPTPTGPCDSHAQVERGTITAAGQVTVHPSAAGELSVGTAGSVNACLDGPDGADYDLYLDRWDGTRWRAVAFGLSATADEKLTYAATAGRYRLRVHGYSGTGDYTIGWTPPAG